MFGRRTSRRCCLSACAILAGTFMLLISVYNSETFQGWVLNMGPSQDAVRKQFSVAPPERPRPGGNNARLSPPYLDKHPIRPFNSNNSANGKCVRGYVQSAMAEFIPSFNPDEHLFLNSTYKSWQYTGDSLHALNFPLGLGVGNEAILDSILEKISNHDKVRKNRNECKTCILVGSSGVSLGQKLGKVIDSYDVVIRMNNAPIKGFEEYIGSKTTFRFQYPESAFPTPEDLEADSEVVFIAYKRADLYWLNAIINSETPTIAKLPIGSGINHLYWKSVPPRLAKPPQKIRLVNPHIVLLTAYEHVGSRYVPTLGMISMVTTLYFCDQVHIAGYGVDPKFPFHYYSSDMAEMPNTVHDWNHEKSYIMNLLRYGIIEKDLTGVFAEEVRERWKDS